MTRKDYVAIAEVINQHVIQADAHQDITGFFAISGIAAGIATVMENDNPRFDRDKFLKACGI